MATDPWTLFLITYTVSGLTAVTPILLAQRKLSLFMLFGTIGFYGGLGSSFGMLVAYDYLGGRDQPIKVVCWGILIGLGALTRDDVRQWLLRIFLSGEKDARKHHERTDA